MTDITAVQPLSEEDAALLVAAHLDLLAAQVEGVTVLGSDDGAELVAAAHKLMGTPPAHTLALVIGNHGRVEVMARDEVPAA